MTDQQRVIPDYDIHLHTRLSPCGAQEDELSSPAAYARTAAELGFATIGISDHFALANPWTPEWLANSGPEIIDEARRVAAGVTGMKVLVGCEAEMVSPTLVTIDADFAKTLDYVLLAPTHFESSEARKEAAVSAFTAGEHMIRFTEAAVHLPFVDAIVHPFVSPEDRIGQPEAYMEFVSDAAIERICRAAVANRIAFEVNGRVASSAAHRAAMRRLFQIAKSEGVKFIVGSDSHKVTSMIRLAAIETYARELGLTRGDFLTIDEVLQWHRARR